MPASPSSVSKEFTVGGVHSTIEKERVWLSTGNMVKSHKQFEHHEVVTWVQARTYILFGNMHPGVSTFSIGLSDK